MDAGRLAVGVAAVVAAYGGSHRMGVADIKVFVFFSVTESLDIIAFLIVNLLNSAERSFQSCDHFTPQC